MLLVRKNMSARRMPRNSRLCLLALSLSSLVQISLCTLVTNSTMASAAGPALRPIPESSQKQASDKVEASKPTLKPMSAVAQPLTTAKSAPLKTTPGKPATGDTAKTGAKAAASAALSPAVSPVAKSKPRVSRPSMVPPPPPNTPSMLSDPSLMGLGYSAYGMQVEYMSREALKDRVKEITIQFKDASSELENRKRLKTEREARAKSFEQLFTEGVVSRRELETSQREANDSTDEVQRLENKYNELSSLLQRVNKRLAAFPQPPGRKSNQKAQQKLKKSQAKVIAPAKQQIKATDSKLIN
jgi:hypothetical protein